MNTMMTAFSLLSYRVILLAVLLLGTAWAWIPLIQESALSIAKLSADIELVERGASIEAEAVTHRMTLIQQELQTLNRAITEARAKIITDSASWDRECGMYGLIQAFGEICNLLKGSRFEEAEARLIARQQALHQEYDALLGKYRQREATMFE